MNIFKFYLGKTWLWWVKSTRLFIRAILYYTLNLKIKREDFFIITVEDKKVINEKEKFILELKYKSKEYVGIDGFYKRKDKYGNWLFQLKLHKVIQERYFLFLV